MLYMHARPDTHIANTILNQPEQNGLACVLERASVCVYEMWLYAHTHHLRCDVVCTFWNVCVWLACALAFIGR